MNRSRVAVLLREASALLAELAVELESEEADGRQRRRARPSPPLPASVPEHVAAQAERALRSAGIVGTRG